MFVGDRTGPGRCRGVLGKRRRVLPQSVLSLGLTSVGATCIPYAAATASVARPVSPVARVRAACDKLPALTAAVPASSMPRLSAGPGCPSVGASPRNGDTPNRQPPHQWCMTRGYYSNGPVGQPHLSSQTRMDIGRHMHYAVLFCSLGHFHERSASESISAYGLLLVSPVFVCSFFTQWCRYQL